MVLCGDVMLGRGIDQLLPHPSGPELREDHVRDAREYVALAEEVNGPIPRPIEPAYVWGDALHALEDARPDVRLINLETSVTTGEHHWPGKGIHYRMHPANVACLTAARIDACALANNHVLDFGRDGLAETLDTLRRTGLRTCGAGRDATEARAPARLALPSGGTLLVFSMGEAMSGIDADWAAEDGRPGVALLPDLSRGTAEGVAARIAAFKRPGDLTVASIHWGGNWGYHVPNRQIGFAHALIDGGVDLVHGHSSHHPRPIERYRGKLVLYGCGDFINDYEGIRGYEAFRGDLRPMYVVTLAAANGDLVGLRLALFQTRRLRLAKASFQDGEWLCETLSHESRDFGTRLVRANGGDLVLQATSREEA